MFRHKLCIRKFELQKCKKRLKNYLNINKLINYELIVANWSINLAIGKIWSWVTSANDCQTGTYPTKLFLHRLQNKHLRCSQSKTTAVCFDLICAAVFFNKNVPEKERKKEYKPWFHRSCKIHCQTWLPETRKLFN